MYWLSESETTELYEPCEKGGKKKTQSLDKKPLNDSYRL
jgi:hypothetical protein